MHNSGFAWVLTVICTSFALIPSEEFLAKVAFRKVWETCVGYDVSKSFEVQIKEAVNQCRNIPPDFNQGHSNPNLNSNQYSVTSRDNFDPKNNFSPNVHQGLYEQNDSRNNFGQRNNPGQDNTNRNFRNNNFSRGKNVNRNPGFLNSGFSSHGNQIRFNRKSQLLQNEIDDKFDKKLSRKQIIDLEKNLRKKLKPVFLTFIDDVPLLQLSSEEGILNYRKKRQSSYNRENEPPSSFSVRDLIDGETRLQTHLSNFSCVLRTVGLVDENGEILLNNILHSIEALPIQPELKQDLLKGIQNCYQIATCFPEDEEDGDLIPVQLQRAYAFLKCAKLTRQVSCLKKDIRLYLQKEVPQDIRGSFDLERAIKRILYIKMVDGFDKKLPNIF